jgi:hypothetical protein
LRPTHTPSTPGIAARHHAATLVALGRTKEALQRYQEVVDRAGTSIYADMAKLGIANVQAAAGQYDTAINTYKELSGRKDSPLPVDGVLMQLGRTYAQAGKGGDARQTFSGCGRVPAVAVRQPRDAGEQIKVDS